jgi:outer membrane receptor protein involved in Fe transport
MVSRIVRLALAASLAAASIASATAFEARLLLPDGSPAASHVVSVVGSPLSVPTDGDGRFRLDPAPRPPFQLVAAAPDGALSAPIEVAELGTGVVELTLEAISRDSVTVLSGVAPGLDLLPASAAAVVSAEALEQEPPQRLVDALEGVAGASKLGEGADSVPALRGLARGRTLILIDGARVTAERRAGPSATFVDPASLEAVEILRGPGSVVYGSDAFGGVINAVTRDPDPSVPVRFSLEGSDGGASQVAASASVSFDAGAGALLVAANGVDADDGEGGDGAAILNSGFQARGAAVRYARPLGSGRLRASLTVDRVDDLGKAAVDSREIRSIYPREDSDRLSLSWLGAPQGAWDSAEAALFYGRYRIELHRDRVPTPTSNRRIDTSDTDARDASLRGVVARPFAGGRLQVGVDAASRFDLGAEVGRVSYEVDGETVTGEASSAAIEDARQLSTGLFAVWSRPLSERLTLGVGARGDRVEARNAGGFFGDRSSSDQALSGNLSLSWTPAPGWTATGQAARGFRAPTLSDRYFRGPSGRGFVTGNPELDPESSLQLDLALRRTLGRSAFALYAYRYGIDDLVERYREGDDFFFRNRGGATIEGLELEARTALGGGWSVDGGAAWTRARGDGGDPIDDAPAPAAWLGARWAEGAWYAFGRLGGVAEKDDPGPTELERPGYLLVDLGGGWRFTDRLEARLAIRNALDRAYTGSPDEAADRSPGRAVLLGLSGRF